MGLPRDRVVLPARVPALLRRRLQERATVSPSRSRTWKSALLAFFRVVLEVDSLFLGRRPGFFGLLVSARAGRDR